MPTLFIAGAGCSRGTLDGRVGCPPTANDFVKELETRVWNWDYPELTKVIKHIRRISLNVGLEELWTCIDLNAKFDGAVPRTWDQSQAVRELP
jgi:hypothetical protein